MKVSAILNGGLLFLFALLLLFAAITPVYEEFMHPRFRPLTVSAAYLLLGLAVVALLGKAAPIHPSNYMILAIVFGVLFAAFFVHYPEGAPAGQWSGDTAEDWSPSFNEDDALMISIPEIYLYSLDPEQPLAGKDLRFRGVVLRRPDLDRQGVVGVGRVYLSCCAADAVRLIFMVDLPPGSSPDQFKDGEWITVKGRLYERAADSPALTTEGLTPDTFATLDVINQIQSIEAEELISSNPPREFFIDTLRGEEPYSF